MNDFFSKDQEEGGELHVMCGIPRSGKSYLAKELAGIVVSKDDIRRQLGVEYVAGPLENQVNFVEDIMIKCHLRNGKKVIVDDCNLRQVRRVELYHLALKYGCRMTLHVVSYDVRRVSEKFPLFPSEVVKNMDAQFIESMKWGWDSGLQGDVETHIHQGWSMLQNFQLPTRLI